MMVNEYVLEIN